MLSSHIYNLVNKSIIGLKNNDSLQIIILLHLYTYINKLIYKLYLNSKNIHFYLIDQMK